MRTLGRKPLDNTVSTNRNGLFDIIRLWQRPPSRSLGYVLVGKSGGSALRNFTYWLDVGSPCAFSSHLARGCDAAEAGVFLGQYYVKDWAA